jgi:Putative F0F1-ATPase subunit Ca2+/Mg2+ transporter
MSLGHLPLASFPGRRRQIRPTIACLRNFSQACRFAAVTTPDPGGEKTPGPMRYAGLGVQLAVILVVFVLAGQWADRKLGTGGIITIAAAFLGFGGTMYSLIRTLTRKDDGEK